MKTPRAVGARGVGEAGQASNLKTDGTAHGPSLCLCNIDVFCGWCLLRLRIDEAFARARSLRLQSIGEPGRGGAWS